MLYFEVFDDEFFNDNSRQFPRILEIFQLKDIELNRLDEYFKIFGITLKDTAEGLYYEIDFV
jgi:hypothetical protein